jgi:hypothetical protein
MSSFTYNDLQFALEARGGRWDIVQQASGATVATGLFPGLAEDEASARALALVKTILPVGVKCVGPDVTHPNTIGDLKIVGPDVTHPNFIYWDKDSVSCPKAP